MWKCSFEISCWIRRASYKSLSIGYQKYSWLKKSLDVDKIILYCKFCMPTNICNTNWISQHYIEGITWWKLHDRYWIRSSNNLITIPWAFWSRNFRKIIILSTALKVAKFQRITLFSSHIKKKKEERNARNHYSSNFAYLVYQNDRDAFVHILKMGRTYLLGFSHLFFDNIFWSHNQN